MDSQYVSGLTLNQHSICVPHATAREDFKYITEVCDRIVIYIYTSKKT